MGKVVANRCYLQNTCFIKIRNNQSVETLTYKGRKEGDYAFYCRLLEMQSGQSLCT